MVTVTGQGDNPNYTSLKMLFIDKVSSLSSGGSSCLLRMNEATACSASVRNLRELRTYDQQVLFVQGSFNRIKQCKSMVNLRDVAAPSQYLGCDSVPVRVTIGIIHFQ